MTTDLLDRHNTGFQHQALFYAGGEELLDSLTRFIGAGMAAREPTLAVLSADTIEILEPQLPASDSLEYRDMREVGRNPARIISMWHDFVQKHDSSTGMLRGVGEPVWPGRTPEELEECRIHEELLNLAFDVRVHWTLLCPYDTSSLDSVVLERARDAHPFPSRGTSEPTSREQPLHLLEGPLAAPPTDRIEFRFDANRLRALRKLALWEAARAGVGDKTPDFVFAVNEVATNSLAHGGGRGRVRLWETERGVVCEVLDRGYIRDPLVGRKRPPTPRVGGHGLWMANQVCDLVQVRSHPAGTVVRLHMYTN